MKHPKDYSVDEVCIFFVSLELSQLVSKIRENAVDGGLLLSLGEADFKNDLGLTGLQTKRVMRGIDFAKELADGKPADATEYEETIAKLEKENKELKDEVVDLRAALQPEPKAAAPPAPQQHQQQPPPPRPKPMGAPVVREGARGATRGAVLGAVAGAVAGTFDLN